MGYYSENECLIKYMCIRCALISVYCVLLETVSSCVGPSAAKSRAGLTSTSSPSLTKTRPTTAGTKTVTTKSAAGAKLKPPTSSEYKDCGSDDKGLLPLAYTR